MTFLNLNGSTYIFSIEYKLMSSAFRHRVGLNIRVAEYPHTLSIRIPAPSARCGDAHPS